VFVIRSAAIGASHLYLFSDVIPHSSRLLSLCCTENFYIRLRLFFKGVQPRRSP